jgi:hypothetical protein
LPRRVKLGAQVLFVDAVNELLASFEVDREEINAHHQVNPITLAAGNARDLCVTMPCGFAIDREQQSIIGDRPRQ